MRGNCLAPWCMLPMYTDEDIMLDTMQMFAQADGRHPIQT